jgi:M6 family metalloprotease-like protein
MKKILLLILIGLLAACESSALIQEEDVVVEPEVVVSEPVEVEVMTYVVRYHYPYLNEIKEQVSEANEIIELPKLIREGYEFLGWYFDVLFTEPADNQLTIKSDVQLFPKFQQIQKTVNVTSDVDLLPAEICRIRVPDKSKFVNPEDIFDYELMSPGFPISEYRIPSKGVVNAQILMIDFPDRPGTSSQETINTYLMDILNDIEEFYSFQSYGQLRFNWIIEPEYVRLNDSFNDLSFISNAEREDQDTAILEAIRITDDWIDYTEISMVLVFLDPAILIEEANTTSSFSLPGNDPMITNDGNLYNLMFVGRDTINTKHHSIMHSIGHFLGLSDLYNSSWEDDYFDQFSYVGVFDLMNWSDDREFGNNQELFAWSKYLLNWIKDDQVRCLSKDIPSTTTHYLSPNHSLTDGDKLIVVPLSNYEALAIEVKDNNPYCVECKGGVYTYLINNYEGSAAGQIILLRPEDSVDRFFRDAFLTEGNSIQFQNINITFIDSADYPIIQIDIT